jgi:glycosyltransferase involved in cell wall biosynthesis
MRTSGGRARIAVVVDHPAQYFAPAFRALARESVDLQVIYWNAAQGGNFDPGFGRHVKWNVDLYSDYDWWTPPSGSKKKVHKMCQIYRKLVEFGPHVLLSFGWSSPVALTGLVYGGLTRRPTLVYSDTNGRQDSSTLRGRLRKPAMRLMLNRVSGAVSTGTANAEFYTKHGLDAHRIYPGTLPIALDAFHLAAVRQRGLEPSGNPRRPAVIGFAGKLLRHKGADELIQAVNMLPRDKSWRLQVVGDGPERSALEEMVSRLSLTDYAEFTGFRNTDEIPALLAAMDVFVMPSRREPRGLVAIEAMAAGTVPVVSSATGVWGKGDAVQDGVNGCVYPAGHPDLLAREIKRLVDDASLRQQLSERARIDAQRFGPTSFAKDIVNAIAAV